MHKHYAQGLVGNIIYVGTEDALVLRVSAAGQIEHLRGFEGVAGREKWYAGSAVIDGKRIFEDGETVRSILRDIRRNCRTCWVKRR